MTILRRPLLSSAAASHSRRWIIGRCFEAAAAALCSEKLASLAPAPAARAPVLAAGCIGICKSRYISAINGTALDIGRFRRIGHGYRWWSATVDDHPVNFAWGHGGQLIVLAHDLDLLVVVTADPMYDVYGSESWRHEKASFDLAGDFIASLPAD